jgi:tetrahydromethanopterin S-methyltransferase subunit G
VVSATDRRIQALLERIEELERRLEFLTIPEKSQE